MGSGKTTVGRLLARAMDLGFIDLDERIEAAAGRSIARIFEVEGESGFRALERRVLRETALEENVVISVGGGAVVADDNRELMAASGTTVWLNPDFATLVRRISEQAGGRRPLFREPEQAKDLFESRRAAYERADLRIDVGDEEDARSVAARVAERLQGERCAT